MAAFIDLANETIRRYGDIKLDEFAAALAEKYPDEDKAIIKTICDCLIYYEYLR